MTNLLNISTSQEIHVEPLTELARGREKNWTQANTCGKFKANFIDALEPRITILKELMYGTQYLVESLEEMDEGLKRGILNLQ